MQELAAVFLAGKRRPPARRTETIHWKTCARRRSDREPIVATRRIPMLRGRTGEWTYQFGMRGRYRRRQWRLHRPRGGLPRFHGPPDCINAPWVFRAAALSAPRPPTRKDSGPVVQEAAVRESPRRTSPAGLPPEAVIGSACLKRGRKDDSPPSFKSALALSPTGSKPIFEFIFRCMADFYIAGLGTCLGDIGPS